MRREPVCQAMILPGGQQVSHDQASQTEGFMEEAFDGCPGHGKHQKRQDDPVRNAHGSVIRKSVIRSSAIQCAEIRIKWSNSMQQPQAGKIPNSLPATYRISRGTFLL